MDKITFIIFLLQILLLIVVLWTATVRFWYPKIIVGNRGESPKIPDLKSGDLLFFSGDSQGENLIKWATRTPYTHISIVAEEDGRIFLWEADVGQGYLKGPRLIPLEEKLDRYKGNKTYAVKRMVVGDRDKILAAVKKAVKKYKEYKMDDTMLCWLSSWFKNEDEIFCSELIALTLEDEGILKLEEPAFYISPRDFLEGKVKSEKIEWEGGFTVVNPP